jgi:hypothetical protein
LTDKRVVLVVVTALATAVLGAVAGSIYLEAVGRLTPPLVSDVAKIALGAIAALLARTSVDPAQLEAPSPNAAEVKVFDQDAEAE